ncbi:hypothetical protein H4R33_002325 [Dimargaris cristalligena]|nr:hypothetical protein H4R33_002325 [Dimargaris cristalligena]
MTNPAGLFAVGVITSIITSFTQSLGLTLQRKSHVDHCRLTTTIGPPPEADAQLETAEPSAPLLTSGSPPVLPYYRRPLWLAGFALFLASSFGGSTVTISLLPVTILAPLGAVTLVSNALFAKWLLADPFSVQAFLATILVVLGGLLIGIFGALPLPSHDLASLITLYQRPAFIAFFTVTEVLVLALLGVIYLLGVQERRAARYPPVSGGEGRRSSLSTGAASHWPPSWDQILEEESHLPTPVVVLPKSPTTSSAPATEATLSDTSPSVRYTELNHPSYHSRSITESRSDPNHGPSAIYSDASAASSTEQLPLAEAVTIPPSGVIPINRFPFPSSTNYSFKARHHRVPSRRSSLFSGLALHRDVKSPRFWTRTKTWVAQHRTMIRGLLYGIVSGMLCSQSLLFAKSGIELLIVTLQQGNNQFTNPLAGFILLALVVTSLSQLYFLNRSLELCSTLVIAPLTFCSYNLSTLLNGLIYYDQFQALAPYQLALVLVGAVILSIGVCILSVGLSAAAGSATTAGNTGPSLGGTALSHTSSPDVHEPRPTLRTGRTRFSVDSIESGTMDEFYPADVPGPAASRTQAGLVASLCRESASRVGGWYDRQKRKWTITAPRPHLSSLVAPESEPLLGMRQSLDE